MKYIIFFLSLFFLVKSIDGFVFVLPFEVDKKVASLIKRNQENFCVPQKSPFLYMVCHEAPKFILHNATHAYKFKDNGVHKDEKRKVTIAYKTPKKLYYFGHHDNEKQKEELIKML